MLKHWRSPFTPFRFLCLSHMLSARAVLRNATIDDHYGDSLTGAIPQFFPPEEGFWQGEECSCPVSPDPQYTFRNTYNAATYRPDQGVPLVSIQMQFTGESLNSCPDLISMLTAQPYVGMDGGHGMNNPNTRPKHNNSTKPAYEHMAQARLKLLRSCAGPDWTASCRSVPQPLLGILPRAQNEVNT